MTLPAMGTLTSPAGAVVQAGLFPHPPGPALQGFNVNLVTTDRVSALHEACLGGHVACAKVLLENGAQVSPGGATGDMAPGNGCSLHPWGCWTCWPRGRAKMQVDVSDRNVEKHNSVLFPWVIDLNPPCIIPLFSFVFPFCVCVT